MISTRSHYELSVVQFSSLCEEFLRVNKFILHAVRMSADFAPATIRHKENLLKLQP
jgi:hypothetical protein